MEKREEREVGEIYRGDGVKMKRVIADFIKREDSPEEFDVDSFLSEDRKYSPVLDLFDGESYYLKMIDREYESTGKNGTTLMRVDSENNQTLIDKKPLNEILDRYMEITEDNNTREVYLNLPSEDKHVMRVGVSILMFFMRVSQDKEIRISDNKAENSIKPSSYRYNPNKPTLIDNIIYVKKEPQGRRYEKQADNWLVRAHYRVRNGVKYLVKGYEKTFKK